jgi:hypothetical protein
MIEKHINQLNGDNNQWSNLDYERLLRDDVAFERFCESLEEEDMCNSLCVDVMQYFRSCAISE